MTYFDLIQSPLNKELGAKYEKQCDEKLKESFLSNKARVEFHVGGMAVSVVYALLSAYKAKGYDVKLDDYKLKFELYPTEFLTAHYDNIVKNNERLKNKHI